MTSRATSRSMGVLASLVLFGALAGAASAGGAYTVHLKVPPSVTQSQSFNVTAKGESANYSHLSVFLTNGLCAKNAHRAKLLGGHQIISANVVGSYTKTRTLTARFVRKHAACAYLTSVPPASITYARAKKLYTVQPAS